MGRTVPTFTNIIDNEVASWAKYRRGLSKDEQEIFDDIFRAAKRHLAMNFYAMRTIPFESIIMSIIIEQGKLIRRLQERVERSGGVRGDEVGTATAIDQRRSQ
jgi:hypothetical protein